ncbi:MAG TPA: hypothetical protein VE397_08150 [Stellaceae bacterium]|jgi:hypothetical protein|nr:hypothetical protein [Stellaceae bacterium]
MEDAAFWRAQSAKFRQHAETTGDPSLKAELSELAEICDDVAAEIEDRAPAG